MEIRSAACQDLAAIAEVEAACFPPAEAASAASIGRRLQSFSRHFWLLWEGDRLVSFVCGMVTDEKDLTDAMYDDAGLHRPDGAWQMIFSVATHPDMRRQGCAEILLNRAIEDARVQGRKGLVLTCKEHMLHYYRQFGFVNEGFSKSEHGNAVWYQMRLTFDAAEAG